MTPAPSKAAFRLRWLREEFTGEPEATLFVVQCEHCGERCGGYSDFPLVNAADFGDFSWQLKLGKMPPTMSWAAFEGLIERARSLSHDPKLELVPNSSLGPIRIRPMGRWPKQLHDIELSEPGGVLFSKRLINLLSAKELELRHVEVTLRDSQGNASPYGLIQASIARTLHAEMFTEHPNYTQCAECGNVKVLRPLIGGLKRIVLDGARREEADPLFRVVGFLRSVFISDRMKSALDSVGPSGYLAEEFGTWR